MEFTMTDALHLRLARLAPLLRRSLDVGIRYFTWKDGNELHRLVSVPQIMAVMLHERPLFCDTGDATQKLDLLKFSHVDLASSMAYDAVEDVIIASTEVLLGKAVAIDMKTPRGSSFSVVAVSGNDLSDEDLLSSIERALASGMLHYDRDKNLITDPEVIRRNVRLGKASGMTWAYPGVTLSDGTVLSPTQVAGMIKRFSKVMLKPRTEEPFGSLRWRNPNKPR